MHAYMCDCLLAYLGMCTDLVKSFSQVALSRIRSIFPKNSNLVLFETNRILSFALKSLSHLLLCSKDDR